MDEYLGVVKLFAFNYAPQNWMPCNGQILPISQNTALFSLLGNTYGGDGQTDFALPKLDASSIHPGLMYCICYQGVYPARQ